MKFFISFFMTLTTICCFAQVTLQIINEPISNRFFAKNVFIDSMFMLEDNNLKKMSINTYADTLTKNLETGKTTDIYLFKKSIFECDISPYISKVNDSLRFLIQTKNRLIPIYIPITWIDFDNPRIEITLIKYNWSLKSLITNKKYFGVLINNAFYYSHPIKSQN